MCDAFNPRQILSWRNLDSHTEDTISMNPLRTLVAISFALICASAAFAQGSRHDGIAIGEQGRPVAGASVVVCNQPANITVTPCTPLANLFTDATLSTAASNPLTSDGLGNG